MDKHVLSTEANAEAGGRRPASRRRIAALALLGALAVLLHAAILSGLQASWPGDAPALPHGGSLHVRVLDMSSNAPAGAGANAPIEGPAPARPDEGRSISPRAVEPVPARVVARRRTGETRAIAQRPAAAGADGRRALRSAAGPAAKPSAGAVAGVTDTPAPEVTRMVIDAQVLEARVRSDAQAREAARVPPGAAASETEPLPLYSTRPAPPAMLRYALRLGASTGEAELRWRPTSERYSLQLEGQVEGGAALRQVSEGGFDIAGLAPVRHTEQRTRRGMLATNFQREAGRISFSGSGLQLPLGRGSQDRLSWIVQLAAVLAAEPERRLSGAVVDVPVAGLRGESGVWRFRAADSEPEPAGLASAAAVRLVRERQGPYDVDIEVWLDPARHFLPARVVMRTASGAPAFELLLRDAVFGP